MYIKNRMSQKNIFLQVINPKNKLKKTTKICFILSNEKKMQENLKRAKNKNYEIIY